MVTDVNDPCCRVPSCPNTPAPNPVTYTPTPKPGGPVPTAGQHITPGPQPTTLIPFLPNPSGKNICPYFKMHKSIIIGSRYWLYPALKLCHHDS